MHALIIEDEPLIAMLIEEELRTRGYDSFDLVADQASAIQAARRRCPDLITSDVRLGSGCGIAAVTEICKDKTIPVIFITATAWELRERGSEAVAIAKPFGSADFSRALAEIAIAHRTR
jgi:DNA-binding response OmpR family regulator